MCSLLWFGYSSRSLLRQCICTNLEPLCPTPVTETPWARMGSNRPHTFPAMGGVALLVFIINSSNPCPHFMQVGWGAPTTFLLRRQPDGQEVWLNAFPFLCTEGSRHLHFFPRTLGIHGYLNTIPVVTPGFLCPSIMWPSMELLFHCIKFQPDSLFVFHCYWLQYGMLLRQLPAL